MPYIGRSANQGVRTRFIYQATAGQTSFSGSDANSNTLTYSDGEYVDVYQNGILLQTCHRLHLYNRHNSGFSYRCIRQRCCRDSGI